MIRVFAESDHGLNVLREVLNTRPWTRISSITVPSGGEPLIMIVEKLSRGPRLERLLALRNAVTLAPVIICTPFDRDSIRWLGKLRPDWTVWLDDAPFVLDRALTELLHIPLRVRLGREIENSAKLSRPMRDAIVHGLAADKPPITVKGLATVAACDFARFERHWRREILPHTGMMPHKFVQWLLILHGHERRIGSSSTWPEAARELRVDIKTLRSAGYATLDRCLRAIASMSELEIAGVLEGHLRTLHRQPATHEISP